MLKSIIFYENFTKIYTMKIHINICEREKKKTLKNAKQRKKQCKNLK